MRKIVILDTCSILNLISSALFEQALEMLEYDFVVGDIVLSEFNPISRDIVQSQIDKGSLRVVPGDGLVEVFSNFSDQFDLGDGELECLAHAFRDNYLYCTDDKKARQIGTHVLTSKNVMGSIRIMQELVTNGHHSCQEMTNRYQRLRINGRFLPSLSEDFFCTRAA